jgi:hypothetical protein
MRIIAWKPMFGSMPGILSLHFPGRQRWRHWWRGEKTAETLASWVVSPTLRLC